MKAQRNKVKERKMGEVREYRFDRPEVNCKKYFEEDDLYFVEWNHLRKPKAMSGTVNLDALLDAVTSKKNYKGKLNGIVLEYTAFVTNDCELRFITERTDVEYVYMSSDGPLVVVTNENGMVNHYPWDGWDCRSVHYRFIVIEKEK